MYELYHGDCLAVMPSLPSQSVDAVICDPPYGTTACKWDSVIPLAPMWEQVKRLIKPRGAIVLFSSQPFTSVLVMSNTEWFRYEWIWDKGRVTGWLDCKHKPLKAHENICVFYARQDTYRPQMTIGSRHMRGPRALPQRTNETYGTFFDGPQRTYESSEWYPRSLLSISSVSVPTHPNEKPVKLLEYLVNTYTIEGDTVLDFAMGSGTTGHACATTGRHFVGIEQDAAYFKGAQQRIADAYAMPMQLRLVS